MCNELLATFLNRSYKSGIVLIGCLSCLLGISFAQAQTLPSNLSSTQPAKIDHLKQQGMSLIWHDQLSDADIGKPLNSKLLYGKFATGQSATRWDIAQNKWVPCEPIGHVGIVPDDPTHRIAQQFDIPPRSTFPADLSVDKHLPRVGYTTIHFPQGVQHAGLAADIWLPEDAQFTRNGRWPLGLWVGPAGTTYPPKSSGGSHPDSQRSATLRLNRGGSNDARFILYSYHLNRLQGQAKYASTFQKGNDVYGYLGKRSMPTPRGRWVTVEMALTMNHLGQTDGGMVLWHDGQLVEQIQTGIDWGADKGWAIRGIKTYHMWHKGAPQSPCTFWIANLKIYSETTPTNPAEN